MVALALGLTTCLNAPVAAEPQLKKAAPVQAMPINRWPDEQFENWYFNQVGSAKAARQRYDSSLTLHLEAIDRICRLTDEQKKKLELVGRGDIKRVYDNFEKAKFRFNSTRKRCSKAERDHARNPADANERRPIR